MPPTFADQLRERVAATGLVAANRRLLVMLSGGRDSVCLLAVAHELGARVTALHVNYGLRGAESDADQEHCERLCEQLGVALELRRAPAPPPGNVQAWARELRYGAAAEAASESDIATAHTATDQLETVLYRLATSPGRRALTGMPVRRGAIVRPLLAAGATRADSERFCAQRGLSWRDDSSNSDRSYARTRVRESLLPALLAVDERAHDNVLQTADLLRDEAAVLDGVVADVLDGQDSIALRRLAELPPALGRLVLRELAERATGRSGARAAARLPDVVALGDGMLDVGDGARVVIERGIVSVVRHG